jgi:tetratricopeptide (TPR) repeat protein
VLRDRRLRRLLLVGTMEGFGDIRRIQGDYTEAERVLREALAIAEDRLGDDNLQVAGVLNAVAITFKYSGRFDDAADLYRRALAIIESVLGSEHADVASLLRNLGGLAHARGDYERARGRPPAAPSRSARTRSGPITSTSRPTARQSPPSSTAAGAIGRRRRCSGTR